ncbi:MAG: hypothetical protein ACI93R_001329 [Flavobacteriales bacterium]|jgi:hypothetical protein
MDRERRRFFRINELVGLNVQVLGDDAMSAEPVETARSVLDLVSQQDEKIERLLRILEEKNPAVAELLALMNQKIERVSRVLVMEQDLLERVAHRVQEVNLSACGIAFHHETGFAVGAHVGMELVLYPSKATIMANGVMVSCDRRLSDGKHFYCRADFYGMDAPTQEALIQHIVQSQSSQLKTRTQLT